MDRRREADDAAVGGRRRLARRHAGRAGARRSCASVIGMLDRGEVRVAEVVDGDVVVNEWAKHAILMWFRVQEMQIIEAGPFEYVDKLPLKHGYKAAGVRVVPGASARFGAYLAPRRRDDAELREHRRVRRRAARWSTRGRRSGRARRSARTCTSRAASASAACSSRRRRCRSSSRTTASSARAA